MLRYLKDKRFQRARGLVLLHVESVYLSLKAYIFLYFDKIEFWGIIFLGKILKTVKHAKKLPVPAGSFLCASRS